MKDNRRNVLLAVIVMIFALAAACNNPFLYKDKKPVYTVSFNSNGGSAVDDMELVSGGKIDKPEDPTRDGFSFGGWYRDDTTFADEWDFDADTVTGNITLYAKWIEISGPPSVPAMIAFDGFGDEEINLEADAENIFSRGQQLQITVNGEYDSYSWFVDGVLRSGEDADSFTITIPDSWTIGVHHIMAVVNFGGKPYSKELTFRVVAPYIIMFTSPDELIVTYGDAPFTNVISNPHGVITYASSNTAVAAVDPDSGEVTIVTAGNTVITAEKALDEVYAAATGTYTLRVNPKPLAITGLSAQDKLYDGEASVTVTGSPSISGIVAGDDVSLTEGAITFENADAGAAKAVVFTGWSLNGADADNYSLILPSLTANIMFSVSFDKNNDNDGSTEADPQTKIAVTAIDSLPDEPTRPDYVFIGWNTKADGSGTPFTTVASSTANIIVYAQWKFIYSYVSFDKNNTDDGSNEVDPQIMTVIYPTITIDSLPNEPTRSGYTFIGWNTEADGNGTPFTVDTPVTDDIAVYAEWIQGDGTVSSPFLINNVKTLQKVGTEVLGLDKHYKLIEDIILPAVEPGESNWTAIGDNSNQFTGSFDGQGHTISNLTINNNAQYQGMFGYIGSGGIVQNVGLVGCNVIGRNYVGGVAGYNNSGTVENCYSTGNVSGTGIYIGGAVGYNSGTVKNCYSTGDVSVAGIYAGNRNIGGVVGYNSSGTVRNCYSTGDVSGIGNNIGGVVGYNGSGTVGNCYSTGDVSGTNNVGGVEGYNSTVTSNTRQNCVALNLNVTATADTVTIGRVMSNNVVGTNNYARSDMTLTYDNGNSTYTPANTTSANNNKDGADITAAQWHSAGWWENTALFDPDVWNLEDNKLPTLKDVSGEQNPVIQD